MILRSLEFFCGIGGFSAAAAGTNLRVVGAMDSCEQALSVYQLNFPTHPICRMDLQNLTLEQLRSYQADLWWLAPPSRPFRPDRAGREIQDPENGPLMRLMDLFQDLAAEDLPRHLMLESIAGFCVSQSRDRLLQILADRGYDLTERETCPTHLGVPSRRPRYYLLASRQGLRQPTSVAPSPLAPLESYLGLPEDSILATDLRVYPLEQAPSALLSRAIRPERQGAYTACFGPSYGQCSDAGQPLLYGEDGIRRFAPEEIARLLHMPEDFRFPPQLPLERRWQLLGSSPSAASIRWMLHCLPGFRLN